MAVKNNLDPTLLSAIYYSPLRPFPDALSTYTHAHILLIRTFPKSSAVSDTPDCACLLSDADIVSGSLHFACYLALSALTRQEDSPAGDTLLPYSGPISSLESLPFFSLPQV